MAEKFSVMQGLFGLNPGQAATQVFDQGYDESLNQQAALAKLDPMQRIGAFQGVSGQMIGNAGAKLVGGMLGADIEEPNVKRARLVQESLRGLPPEAASDPRAFGPILMQKFQENGMGNEAVMLGQELQNMMLGQAKTRAEVGKLQKEASGIGNVTPKDFTPASLKRFQETGDYSVLEVNPSSKAAPLIMMEQFNEKIDKMQREGITFDQLDPYEQVRVFGLASQVYGPESAKQTFPMFTQGGAMTVEEAKSMRFATMMATAEPTIRQLEKQGFKFRNIFAQAMAVPEMKDQSVLSILKMYGATNEELRAMDAYLQFLGPALYQKTGAAVTASEFNRDMRGSVAWEWDNDASLGEKQRMRRAQLVGTEQGLSAAGVAAYNRSLEQMGLPPLDREIRGPLDKKAPKKEIPLHPTAVINPGLNPAGTPTKSPREVSGTIKPMGAPSGAPKPGTPEFNAWWNGLSTEERVAHMKANMKGSR